jgi:hypothetical protein
MPRWSTRSYLQVVRASAAYDLVVTAPFATPWTLAWVHAGLGATADALGVAAPPPLDTMQVLFANLLGIVVVVWALVRLRAPSVTLGRHDAAARAGFALAQAYALAHGATPLLAGFTTLELVFLAAQLPAPRGSAR